MNPSAGNSVSSRGPARHRTVSRASAQRGAVLFVVLMFLLLLTLLGIAASGTSVLQERMTGGMRNSQLGFMGADSTLRDGEFQLWNLANQSTLAAGGLQFHCGQQGLLGRCFTRRSGVVDPRVLRFRDGSGPPSDGTPYGPRDMAALSGDELTARLAAQPTRIVEDLGQVADSLPWAADGEIYAQGGAGDPQNLHLYRITARSPGGSDAVQRSIESTFVALVPKSFIAGNDTP